MRALVVTAPGHYGLQEIPMPKPGPGEVLIRSRAVGVNRSFVDLLSGRLRPDWVTYPVIPGHEWSGTVEALGPGVPESAFVPGDRVVVEGLLYCGTCVYCRRGLTNLCLTYDQHGFTRPGGCAEYVSVPVKHVFRLPPSVSFEAAALVEPAAVALRGILRGRPELGDTVAVIGPGTLGLVALLLLRLFAPARIILIGVTPHSLELGRELGATHLINAALTDPVEAVQELTAGLGVDLVFEAAGSSGALDTALRIVRMSGRVVTEGLPPDTGNADLRELLLLKDLDLHGVLSYTSQVWAQVVRQVAGGGLRLDPVVRHRIPLAQFQQALDLMNDPDRHLGKIMLIP
jgi:threonine dehydrogenase-like Zn-dependent dehydrogenase